MDPKKKEERKRRKEAEQKEIEDNKDWDHRKAFMGDYEDQPV